MLGKAVKGGVVVIAGLGRRKRAARENSAGHGLSESRRHLWAGTTLLGIPLRSQTSKELWLGSHTNVYVQHIRVAARSERPDAPQRKVLPQRHLGRARRFSRKVLLDRRLLVVPAHHNSTRIVRGETRREADAPLDLRSPLAEDRLDRLPAEPCDDGETKNVVDVVLEPSDRLGVCRARV